MSENLPIMHLPTILEMLKDPDIAEAIRALNTETMGEDTQALSPRTIVMLDYHVDLFASLLERLAQSQNPAEVAASQSVTLTVLVGLTCWMLQKDFQMDDVDMDDAIKFTTAWYTARMAQNDA